MRLYHGSPIGDLTVLRPYQSDHDAPYVYLTENPVVALFYTVHPLEKPFSFYPYGFDSDGTVHYSEYYPRALQDVYQGKAGHLYACDVACPAENPTHIRGVRICREPVCITQETAIADVYDRFMEYQRQGLFRIRAFDTISAGEMEMVYHDLQQTIEKYQLIKSPDASMSRWIRTHFPSVWGQISS